MASTAARAVTARLDDLAPGADSGGALAIATCNKVLMLEHSIYTVASPEAAASILWRDSSRAQDAATSMKITATDLLKFGIIDGIVSEPIGGAHREPGRQLGDVLELLPADRVEAVRARAVVAQPNNRET